MTMQLASADEVIAELLGDPVGACDVRTLAPAAAGLYAWWAKPEVLPALKGRSVCPARTGSVCVSPCCSPWRRR